MTDPRAYAVFGVSLTDPTKYGSRIFRDLLRADYQVYAVNPKGGVLFQKPVYKSLSEVPVKVYGAILVVPPAAVMQVVEQCITKGVQEIYFQPGARDPKAYQRALSAGLQATEGCFMAENGLW